MIESFKEQIEYSLEAEVPKIKKEFDVIVVLGIGGSALAGELLKDYYDKKPVIVLRDYHLPGFVDKRCLIFAVSYSGDTEETIFLYKEAVKRGCQIIILASGGELKRLSRGKNFLLLPKGLQPRDAVPSMFLLLLRVLGVNVDSKKFMRLVDRIDKKKGGEIVHKLLEGKMPVIYGGSERYKGVVLLWKNYLNENSKLLCHSNVFSEVNHNEIEARSLNKFVFVLLDDPDMKGQMRKQIEFSDRIFHFHRIILRGSPLEKMFYGALMAGFVSGEYARIKGVDSYKIARIERLKRFLKNV